MKPFHIPLRVVFYREDEAWIAHCLEFDLVGDGDTREAALQSLAEAIGLQLEASVEHDNPRNLFRPAPGEFFQMFAELRCLLRGGTREGFASPLLEGV